MIEAKLLYRARCEVCREPFGQTHSSGIYALDREDLFGPDRWTHRIVIAYDGPHVCPTCEDKEKLKANAAGARDAELLANVTDKICKEVSAWPDKDSATHGILWADRNKKQKGETK